jgi:ABC-type phosphate transport system auxiliary subunit
VIAKPPELHAEECEQVTLSQSGQLKVQWRSVVEAKLCIKKLRLLKRHIQAEKRAATGAQRKIRAEYMHMVRQRGSKMRGGGFVESLVRTAQTLSRDAARADLANRLAPLEAQRNKCDHIVSQIESVILKIEAAILG